MALAVTPIQLLGVVAGVAMLGLGAFVVMAQPRSTVTRAFFLLAIADGASTILFALRNMATTVAERAYFMATYEYFFIAFVALLAGFGLLVPRPAASRSARRALAASLVVAALVALVAYVIDHGWFWRVDPARGTIRTGPAGFAVNIAFILLTGIVCARLTRTVLVAEATLRRQAAFILGGMALGYGSLAISPLAAALPGGTLPFDPARPGLSYLYGSYVVTSAILVACIVVLVRQRRRLDRDVRRFLLGSALGMLAMVALSNLPGSSPAAVQFVALLAYPIILGYAIVRYAVFDIDAKLRRAATLTFVAAGVSGAFLVTENVLASLIEDRLFSSAFASTVTASIVAAIAAALVLMPIVRVARSVASRVVPSLSSDALAERKREVYRHSLAGALLDGLDEEESATLARLRDALGITADEHALLVRDIKAAAAGA